MTSHALGEITLSISTIIYFIWFLPQIWMTYRRKSTVGLSLWMHSLLFLGYSADLLYGFGREMQWQYRLVTIVGLVCLLVQHIQFARYGLQTKAVRRHFAVLSILLASVFVYALFNLIAERHGKMYYDMAGLASTICWTTYFIPQIIKNFRLKSTKGLSVAFVVIALVLSLLDITSTFALHWAWPSVLSECLTLIKKIILVAQMVYYSGGIE